jgi:serine/threonine-protein kinase HipA
MTSTSERAVVFIRLPGMDYVPAGLLLHEDRAYFFRYGRRYLERPDALPIDSARMPLMEELRHRFALTEATSKAS